MQLGNPHRINAIRHAWGHQADLTHQLQRIQRSPQQRNQLVDLLKVKTVAAINPQGRPTAAEAATEATGTKQAFQPAFQQALS